MKNINGTNKLERQITKAKKYLGLELVERSNTKLSIKSVEKKDNTFVIARASVRFSNNGELAIIDPTNNKQEKPYFVKAFSIIETSELTNNMIIFNLFYENQIKDMQELVEGNDDVFNLNELLKTQSFQIDKN